MGDWSRSSLASQRYPVVRRVGAVYRVEPVDLRDRLQRQSDCDLITDESRWSSTLGRVTREIDGTLSEFDYL